MAELSSLVSAQLEIWGVVVRAVVDLSPKEKQFFADWLVEFARVTAVDLRGGGDGFAYSLMSSHRVPIPERPEAQTKPTPTSLL